MLLPALCFMAACSKKSFDDRYNDPERTTKGSIDGLYTGLFKNRRIIPDYWHLWTFTSLNMGIYTQTVGFNNSSKIYEPGVNYSKDRWDDFYAPFSNDGNWTAPVSNFREMEKLYDGLEKESEKAGYLLFMETARIFVYDQATQMVDLWGDIPFTQAGMINKEGLLVLPAYDDARQIYDSAFYHLKRISNYLATVQPEQFYLGKLAKQDVLFGGDLNKWRRYANSLILRLAMRISYVDEEGARKIAQEIMTNPTLYPLMESAEQNALIKTGSTALKTDLTNAFNEGHNVGPDVLIDSLLEPSGDPRLRFMYAKNKNGEYQGLPHFLTETEQSTLVSNNLVSILNPLTYSQNTAFPGIIMTCSEVYFLKAEYYERWGGGSAKTYYDQGIRKSIDFYYSLHTATKIESNPPETPANESSEIVPLLQHPLVAYGAVKEENLRKIATQKWVDFGLMQNTQSWAEIRRTGYPKLTFREDISSSIARVPAYRMVYPSTERQLNAENYAKVAAKDQPFSKIFWMR